ncbi:MAG: alginate export family protein [Bryobacteraceae bacterium]|nr:alginate export family protein [Bryobacteraceae bacterium]
MKIYDLLRGAACAVAALFAGQVGAPLGAQSWDVGSSLGGMLSDRTDGKLKLGAESRVRYESRAGNAFGRDPDISDALVRTRLSLSYKINKWLKFSGMVQDSRSPWYGPNAPNTVRDPVDLQESYLELFPDRQKGFGFSAGRRMLNYGEARLIGSPQWGNLSRTFDHARAYYRTSRAQFEALLVSPVKIQIGEFNRPFLGDRVWGAYNIFPDLWSENRLDVYLLRRDQNRPGGFTGGNPSEGTDRLGVNTFGLRLAGPLAWSAKYSLEAAVQNGKVGPAAHRGHAWFSGISRRWTAAKRPLDVSAEYKFASGNRNPRDVSLSRTFDQLYPANHDKFGHEDLFSWRNIHNARSLATYGLTKNLAVNLMYNSFWLASARDALYSGAGKSIARSADGSAGRHVGQEADVFATYKYGHFQFGAGYGHFFAGGFVNRTTPGVSPVYLYVFHTYTL